MSWSWNCKERKQEAIRTIMEIRALLPADREPWRRLRQLLWPDLDDEENLRDQAEILEDLAHNAVFVAASPGGELAGFVEASLRKWAEGCSTSPVGYVEGWYVQPAHRRARVGAQLIEAAEDWARAQGCTEMGSDAEDWNEISHAAHRALGYIEATRLVCFAKQLGEGEGEDT